MFGYKEEATVNSSNTSLPPRGLLSEKKQLKATSLLRGALTLCKFLGLDNESMFGTVDREEQEFQRKVFWLLFITERGYAMQYNAGLVLFETRLPFLPRKMTEIQLSSPDCSLWYIFLQPQKAPSSEVSQMRH